MSGQRGSFIVLCLVVISVLSGLTLLNMQNALHSSRLARSYLSYDLAFNRAQATLQQAQQQLDTTQTYRVGPENKPLEHANYPSLVGSAASLEPAWYYIYRNDLWLNSDYCEVQQVTNEQKLYHSNEFVSAFLIEKMINIKQDLNVSFFRITATGYGIEANTKVILQVIIKADDHKTRISWLMI